MRNRQNSLQVKIKRFLLIFGAVRQYRSAVFNLGKDLVHGPIWRSEPNRQAEKEL
jgi:hypothetical protein